MQTMVHFINSEAVGKGKSVVGIVVLELHQYIVRMRKRWHQLCFAVEGS